MNYMKEVAHMLGVELNEEFNINISGKTKLRFTENGLEYYYGTWLKCSEINEILAGKCEIIKIPKPILDEKEKEYLSTVIKPFRDRIIYICKRNDSWSQEEWLHISFGEEEGWLFPPFDAGTLYKGMEQDKEYTLEELGL